MNSEDVDALRYEYFMTISPGWAVFKATATERFQEDSAKLSFGAYRDDRERMQAEGRCQFFKWICDHEAALKSAWEDIQKEQTETQTPDEMEGGDLGVHYEAAQ